MDEAEKLAQIRRLIHEFNQGMRALTGGEPIPIEWKKLLLAEVQAKPEKRPGVAPDYEKIRKTVKEIWLAGAQVRQPRTKTSSAKDVMVKIAKKVDSNLKAVQRVEQNMPILPQEYRRADHFKADHLEMYQAYVGGMSDALTEKRAAHDREVKLGRILAWLAKKNEDPTPENISKAAELMGFKELEQDHKP